MKPRFTGNPPPPGVHLKDTLPPNRLAELLAKEQKRKDRLDLKRVSEPKVNDALERAEILITKAMDRRDKMVTHAHENNGSSKHNSSHERGSAAVAAAADACALLNKIDTRNGGTYWRKEAVSTLAKKIALDNQALEAERHIILARPDDDARAKDLAILEEKALTRIIGNDAFVMAIDEQIPGFHKKFMRAINSKECYMQGTSHNRAR